MGDSPVGLCNQGFPGSPCDGTVPLCQNGILGKTLEDNKIELAPGDLLVMGTPEGVGHARRPPLWMKDGDVCEIEIEAIGILSNPIVDETA